ncbi:unnamed protein product [Choristocarpus tenellus]
MRMGIFPTRALLAKYDLGLFNDYAVAIRSGHAGDFDKLMVRDKDLFTLTELELPMENSRLLVYRQVLWKIVRAIDSRRLPFSLVVSGLNFYGKEMDIDEVEFMIIRLIDEGLLRGLVNHESKVLTIPSDKGRAFPPLRR